MIIKEFFKHCYCCGKDIFPDDFCLNNLNQDTELCYNRIICEDCDISYHFVFSFCLNEEIGFGGPMKNDISYSLECSVCEKTDTDVFLVTNYDNKLIITFYCHECEINYKKSWNLSAVYVSSNNVKKIISNRI